jgi:hypothetical protein
MEVTNKQMEKQMKKTVRPDLEPSDLNWPNKKEFYATQFEKLGFKKIPTEDGFTMFELDPAKLREEKPAASKPGLRIVEHVKWEGKDYSLPFYGMDLDTDRNKMITIQNRFGGDSVTIPWFAAAVYDVIMGSEKLENGMIMERE